MMKQSYKKLIFLFILVVGFVYIFNTVNAEINKDYYGKVVSQLGVAEHDLDSKVSGSSLLSAIALLIYAVGSLLEWLLGGMFELITGSKIFPWADVIVFNAVPLLDVNFINPSTEGSIVYVMQNFLSKIYGTLFGVAFAFFSTAVLIMAIKLVISAIASEKAKYKQALIQWFIGLLLLFTIHYGISFIFYLNESLVNMASDLTTPYLELGVEQIRGMNTVDEEESLRAVNTFIKSMKTARITDILSLGIKRLVTSYDSSYGYSVDTAAKVLRDNPNIAALLLQDQRYTNWRFGEYKWYNFTIASNTDFWVWKGGDNCFVKVVADNVTNILKVTDKDYYTKKKNEEYEKIKKGSGEQAKYEFFCCMEEVYKYSVEGKKYSKTVSLINNLGYFFKTSSWTVGKNAWRADSVSIQYALLYAILVVQSLILFISYAKRVFFTVILAMLAPVVVVFDFFNNSIGKGQKVLGAWLKEFCQLVFIQTMQAFIYAIITILIISLLISGNNSGTSNESINTSLGILAVIALLSVFKVEDIVRKIFGFGPTKADHGGAVKSIAKTAFAVQLGKRVLDNGKKFVGGAGKIIKSGKDAKKARKELAEDERDLRNDMTGSLSNEFRQEYGNAHNAGSVNGAGGGNASRNYNQRIRALKRENEKRLSELKAQRKEGIKSMASGVLETGGALFGSATGAIIGGADGNLDEAVQGLMAGAGIGDAVGQTVVNITTSAGTFAKNRISGAYGISKSIRDNYSQNRYNDDSRWKSFEKSVTKEIKDRSFQLDKYSKEVEALKDRVKQLDTSVNNID